MFLSILYRADRSDKVWLPEHIAAMQRVASPEFWPLFLGAVFMGLRQGDLRKLPWSAYDGNALTWRITKRRKGDAVVKVTIPCVTALRLLLDSLPRNGPLIFTTVTGRAWQKRYVARHFEIARTGSRKIARGGEPSFPRHTGHCNHDARRGWLLNTRDRRYHGA